jgi:chromosome segregation protein
LEQRDTLEADRTRLEKSYYGGSWHELSRNVTEVKIRVDAARERETKFLAEAKAMQEELAGMEKAVPPSVELDALRQSLEDIAEERSVLRERQAKLYAEVEIAKAKVQAQRETRTPLSFSKIIEAVEKSQKHLDDLLKQVSADKPDVGKIKPIVESLHAHHADFSNRLQRPVMEDTPVPATDPEIEAGLKKITADLGGLAARTKEAQANMAELNRQEEGKRAHLFETQRKLNARRDEARQAEHAASEAAVELARWETRRDAFLAELREHRSDLESGLDALAKETGAVDQVDALLPQISRIRSQLEWIGNIDPATQKEHAETKERFEFLTAQVDDLRGAIRGLDTVIAELDETIRTKSEQAFHILNSEFSKTFKLLFGGGEAELLQMAPEPTVDEEGNLIQPPADAPAVGIDIQATPPGKRLKSIALLSGGERALTSIALISAIMATNPSPFIVLDEVDAALDEVNTKKYADILEERANATQFIVVTHNRTTMHQANTMYGVTLAEDGSSKVLSVRLEDVGSLHGKE